MSLTTAGPAHRVQSAVEDYGYPLGHLGHLTTEEEEAFENFKLMCEEKGYYKPGSEHDIGTHDDATLLYVLPKLKIFQTLTVHSRFLRARRFVVPEAYKQFVETEEWRKANELDKLYETIDLDHYEETRRLVDIPPILLPSKSDEARSIRNGQAAAIVEVFLSTFSKSNTSIRKQWPPTRGLRRKQPQRHRQMGKPAQSSFASSLYTKTWSDSLCLSAPL